VSVRWQRQVMAQPFLAWGWRCGVSAANTAETTWAAVGRRWRGLAKAKTQSAECCCVFACDGAGGLLSNIYLAAGSGSAGSTGGRGL